MCRQVTILITLILSSFQESFGTQYAFRVNFTNKVGTSSFSDSLSFLSHRAMERRDRFGILLDSTDLPVSPAYIDSVLTLTGGKLHEKSKWYNFCVVLVTDSNQIHQLNGKPFVSSYQLVGAYSTFLHRGSNPIHTTTTKSSAKTTTGDAAYYSQTWGQTDMVHGEYLHDWGYRGENMYIAVLDAGFIGTDTHSAFDSLRLNGRLLETHNFTLDTSYVYGYDDHGSKVLSTMAGYVPDTFVGSAPNAYYALYVTEDDNSEQPIELLNLLCASEKADSLGADVITCSLGYNTFDNSSYNFTFSPDLDGKTTMAAKAANMATRKGMIFVASAGNEGGDSWNNVLTPGDADSALTIGSVDNTGLNAPTSGYGPNASGQVKPDVCGLGRYAAIINASFGGYTFEDGTSFSTPQIAGWAACLWQASPKSSPGEIRRAIQRCASMYISPTNQMGYGIPDMECTSNFLNVRDTPTPIDQVNWVKVVPNPVNHELTLQVSLPTTQDVYFRLLDITGREVMTESGHFLNGTNAPVSYSIDFLPAGVYTLKSKSGSLTHVTKVMKL